MSFELGADLREVNKEKDKLRVQYSLFVDTYPMVQRAELAGDAVVNLPQAGGGERGGLSETTMNDVALEIYRANYEHLYLALETLGLSCPSPWLVRDVNLVGSA